MRHLFTICSPVAPRDPHSCLCPPSPIIPEFMVLMQAAGNHLCVVSPVDTPASAGLRGCDWSQSGLQQGSLSGNWAKSPHGCFPCDVGLRLRSHPVTYGAHTDTQLTELCRVCLCLCAFTCVHRWVLSSAPHTVLLKDMYFIQHCETSLSILSSYST